MNRSVAAMVAILLNRFTNSIKQIFKQRISHTMTIRPKNNPSLLAGLALLFVLLSCSFADAAAFRLLYSNDNMGELDGCG